MDFDRNPISEQCAAFIEYVAVLREKNQKQLVMLAFPRCLSCDRSFALRNQLDRHLGVLSQKRIALS